MNRRKLPGVASATKRLADGTLRRYYYAWRGGPLIKGEDGTPLRPGDPAFHVAFAAAHAARRKPAAGTLFSLIAAFRTSSEFTGIRSEKTKKDYRRYLKMIEDEFGTMPVEAVEDKRARGRFKEWRDTMADRPRTADYAWTVLARVLSVAKDRGAIAINVCERGGRLYETDRTEIIWTADHIKKFCAVASDELQFSLLLALWTGQRQGDVIRLTWMQYDGSKIRLKQGKGKKRAVIPVGHPSKPRSTPAAPRRPKGQSCETPLASRGPAMVSVHRGTRRSSVPVSATRTCTSMTCAGPPSRAWRCLGAPFPRSLPSRAIHRAMWR
jgi:integrase